MAVFLALSSAMVFSGTAGAQIADDLREGDQYFEDGKYKKAAQRYDSAIERGAGQVSAEAYGQRAAIYIIQKDYLRGLAFIIDKAEPQHPDAPEVLEQKALILWLLNRRDEAIAIAEQVVAQRSDSYSNQGILGEFYSARQPAKAITAYEAYFRHRPDSLARNDVLPRVRLGFAYLEEERYRDAETQFQLLLQKHRKRPHAEVNAENGLCAAYTALEEYDRAISLCEKIARSPGKIDRNGSIWYNLGRAYLGKRQNARARAAGRLFIRSRRGSPKGYTLVGDSYFQEENWEQALEQYLEAEKRVKGNGSLSSGELGAKLGATYRRLGRLEESIAVLESAFAASSSDATLASELGSAYLASRDDGKATATVGRLIDGPGFAELDAADKVRLLLIAGKSRYNTGDLDKASERYRSAYQLRKNDVTVRIGLIQTVNLQAYQALSRGQFDTAETYLAEALTIDRGATITNRNLAVLALQKGRCDDAKTYLAALKNAPGTSLIYHRLLARAYRCQRTPDPAAAMKHYALAEKRALDPRVQANLLRAEIYTEWAPMLFASDLDDAVSKLTVAVQLAARNPEVGDAARRNLALASYRRGWKNIAAGKTAAAVSDFQTATSAAKVLQGTEGVVFEFSLAIARLENGETGKAARIFSELASRRGQAGYLRSPYDRVGIGFFDAYAKYRTGNRRGMRQAVKAFTRMRSRARGAFASRLDELTAATWLSIASDAYRAGGNREVTQALRNAKRFARSSDLERVIDNNLVALAMGERGIPSSAMAKLQGISNGLPEALGNIGILHDRAGRQKDAYDSWVRARQRGVRARKLQQWIDAKKRMFGF